MPETTAVERYASGEPAPQKLLTAIRPNEVVFVDAKYVSIETDFNARDFSDKQNKEHVTLLAKSIAANGIENPLRVFLNGDTRIVLVDGESRLRAYHLALEALNKGGLEPGPHLKLGVPVLLDESASDEVARTQSLVIKNMNRPLSILETHKVVKRLVDLGMTRTAIAERLGFSRTHMQNLALLDQATEVVLDVIREGKYSATAAVDMLRTTKDPEIVEKAITSAVARQEREVAAAMAVGKKKTKRAKVRDGVLYTKGNFDGLIALYQRLYAEMTPANDYKKWRGWIRNCLEGMNAPVEVEAVEEAE